MGNQKQRQAESIEEHTGNPITKAPNAVRDFARCLGKILLTEFRESGVPIYLEVAMTFLTHLRSPRLCLQQMQTLLLCYQTHYRNH